jgi:tetratricopeptide (TPR) repeat protein
MTTTVMPDLAALRGDLERAETLIREVVGLAKEAGDVLEQLEARAELGTVLQDQERWAEAQSEFEWVLTSPSSTSQLRARGWLGLGNTAFLTGDFATALSHYDRARALYRPSSPEDYVGTLGAMLESRIAWSCIGRPALATDSLTDVSARRASSVVRALLRASEVLARRTLVAFGSVSA